MTRALRIVPGDILPPELARTFVLGGERAAAVPTGVDALDAELQGGLPRAALTEILAEDGEGAEWLALRALSRAGGRVAILDSDDSFHPPGAAALGLDLSRTLIVRERRPREVLYALERLAREKHLRATLAWPGALQDTFLRRLQLAAERSGQCVMLLCARAGETSWGALRLRVRAVRGQGARVLEVHTLRARGGILPRPVRIEVDDGTLSVRMAAALPHPAVDAGRRALGA